MLVKALIKFRDLKEKKLREIGDDFEVSETRYKEILTKGGKWVKPLNKKLVEVQADYKGFTKDELKKLLDDKDIKYDSKDTKAELIKKLGD